jgi:alpha-glucosidase
MQWNDSAQAGFTTGVPWLPVAPQALTVNVAAQRADPSSLLCLYRRLLHLRRTELALGLGAYKPGPTSENVMVYSRELAARHLLIALNFSHQPQIVTLTGMKTAGTILLSSHLDREGEAFQKTVELRPDEGLIVHLTP